MKSFLSYIAPNENKPLDVTVFSRKGCPFCARAKGLLHDAGIHFEELELNQDYSDRSLRAISGASTFPQIFINSEHIGGAEALEEWFSKKAAA